MIKQLFFCYVFLISFSLVSQEVITDLAHNPYLKNFKFTHKNSKSSLSLPFIDDFSYDSNIVSSDLWQYSTVYVNRTYPINPPTIGVITFDGLDENGFARDFSSNSSEPSDTLLSKKIDLSSVSSAYFLFFFQAKGLGDAPEPLDKLILEFKNDSLQWETVWISEDTILEDFTKVIKVINQNRFLFDEFQFRFVNYATVSGNFDHWHVDYIKIDELQSVSDTSQLNDVSFVYNSPSFLKRYQEMPWSHFLNNEADELKDSIDILLRNNDAASNIDYQFNVFNNGNQVYHYPLIGVSRNVTVLDYDQVGNFSFTDPPILLQSNIFTSFEIDSASFLVENILGTNSSDNKLNDTLFYVQNFHSHFAYDDGTAESAYGINVSGAQIAYEFKLNRPDTLRAIQMYFPQMLDSVNDIPFKLTVWDDLSSTGNILYQQEVFPYHTQNGNYYTYLIDEPFKLVGTFYVGWEQSTEDLLNIGLDKNNVSNSYMFYNIGSGWNQSSYLGSWMIRPVLSMKPIVSSVDYVSFDTKIYPNPVDTYCFVKTSENNCIIKVFSVHGVMQKQIFSKNSLTKLDLKDFSSGIYFIEILQNNKREYKKIILQ
ncbi:MAG: T9SS type A sorting domain-containing protein [Bacteroidota bacterium]|nr:T9SS type A sorting domain-containing protein [Bacteroidota bacterium]